MAELLKGFFSSLIFFFTDFLKKPLFYLCTFMNFTPAPATRLMPTPPLLQHRGHRDQSSMECRDSIWPLHTWCLHGICVLLLLVLPFCYEFEFFILH